MKRKKKESVGKAIQKAVKIIDISKAMIEVDKILKAHLDMPKSFDDIFKSRIELKQTITREIPLQGVQQFTQTVLVDVNKDWIDKLEQCELSLTDEEKELIGDKPVARLTVKDLVDLINWTYKKNAEEITQKFDKDVDIKIDNSDVIISKEDINTGYVNSNLTRQIQRVKSPKFQELIQIAEKNNDKTAIRNLKKWEKEGRKTLAKWDENNVEKWKIIYAIGCFSFKKLDAEICKKYSKQVNEEPELRTSATIPMTLNFRKDICKDMLYITSSEEQDKYFDLMTSMAETPQLITYVIKDIVYIDYGYYFRMDARNIIKKGGKSKKMYIADPDVVTINLCPLFWLDNDRSYCRISQQAFKKRRSSLFWVLVSLALNDARMAQSKVRYAMSTAKWNPRKGITKAEFEQRKKEMSKEIRCAQIHLIDLILAQSEIKSYQNITPQSNYDIKRDLGKIAKDITTYCPDVEKVRIEYERGGKIIKGVGFNIRERKEADEILKKTLI